MHGEAVVTKLRADFEKAPIVQFLEIFPDYEVKACYFHFSQENWRQIQNLGFAPQYLEDLETRNLSNLSQLLFSVLEVL